MLVPLKSSSSPPIVRRLALTDDRLSAAMDQLALRLGAREPKPSPDESDESLVLISQFRIVDEGLRRLSENLYSAQQTLQTLDGVEAVLGEISALVSRAMQRDIALDERSALQQRADLLRPRFAALDNLDLLTLEGAKAAGRSVDRAYGAMDEFRLQVDAIMGSLETAAENLRLAASAWAGELEPDRARIRAKSIGAAIRSQPESGISAQARAATTSALVLLKP